jgi:hypothetical protein
MPKGASRHKNKQAACKRPAGRLLYTGLGVAMTFNHSSSSLSREMVIWAHGQLKAKRLGQQPRRLKDAI